MPCSASGRWGNLAHARARAVAAIGAGAGTVLAVVFASGTFDLSPHYLIPLAGIVIGWVHDPAVFSSLAIEQVLADLDGGIIGELSDDSQQGGDVAGTTEPVEPRSPSASTRRAAGNQRAPHPARARSLDIVDAPGRARPVVAGVCRPWELLSIGRQA